MAVILVEKLKEKLGWDSIHKIDPTKPNEFETVKPDDTNKFKQAAMMAVLSGLYRFGRTHEGARDILSNAHTNWLPKLFGEKTDEVVLQIANRTHHATDKTKELMDKVANNAVECIREDVGNAATEDTLKSYLAGQRQQMLAYLPAELNMGQILKDGTMDDPTNKMDGPVSTFSHLFGALFSTNSDDKDESKNWE